MIVIMSSYDNGSPNILQLFVKLCVAILAF